MWQTLPFAAGGATGEVIIWDFETKGVARASQPHDQVVTAVAWTRDGRHVISASEDCTVSSLSILDNKQVQSPSPLLCSGTLLVAKSRTSCSMFCTSACCLDRPY